MSAGGPPGRETALAYIWVSPGVALTADAQAECIRRYCEARQWPLGGELRARRFPDLTELAQLLAQNDVRRVVLTREALGDLEWRFPEAWHGVRSRVEARGAEVVTI